MSTPPADPKLSADGKFWWDGERWQPMPGAASPAPASPPAPAKVHVVTHAAWWRYVFWAVVILGITAFCGHAYLAR